MLKNSDATLPKKKVRGTNKLVLGFAALAATAVIGTTGVAAAQNSHATGGGYGGNTSNIDLSLDVHGNNNIISIVINLFK